MSCWAAGLQGGEIIGDFYSEVECGLGEIVVDVIELAFRFVSGGDESFRDKVKHALRSEIMVPMSTWEVFGDSSSGLFCQLYCLK